MKLDRWQLNYSALETTMILMITITVQMLREIENIIWILKTIACKLDQKF